jgi:hypothetical protein
MKRIGLSLGLPLLALLLGVAAPRAASAHEGRGGGHVATHAAYGGWRGPVVTRPEHVAPPVRVAPARPIYYAHPGHVVAPSVGRWGWNGGRRVWFGVATVVPYDGWSWTPAHWTWDGYQWIWAEGYWAPPV